MEKFFCTYLLCSPTPQIIWVMTSAQQFNVGKASQRRVLKVFFDRSSQNVCGIFLEFQRMSFHEEIFDGKFCLPYRQIFSSSSMFKQKKTFRFQWKQFSNPPDVSSRGEFSQEFCELWTSNLKTFLCKFQKQKSLPKLEEIFLQIFIKLTKIN